MQAQSHAVMLVTRLRSPIVASVVGKALEALTLVCLVTVVPRLLGSENYGRFALATSAVAIATSSIGLGGPTLLSRFIPAAEPERRAGLAYALVVRLVTLRVFQMLFFATTGAVLVVLAPEDAPPAATLLVVVAIAFDVATTLAFQTALAFGRTSLWSFRWPLQNAILLLLLPPLYYYAGILGAIAAMPLASGTVMLLAVISIWGRVAPPPTPLPPGILRFGLLSALSSVFAQLRQRGGVFAVALLGSSTADTGFTALAINIALAGAFAVSQIFTVELPRLAERVASDPAGTLASAKALSKRLTVAVVPVALCGALLLGEVIPFLAGEEFSAGIDAFAPALATIPLAPLSALLGQLAALHLRPETRLASNIFGTLMFAVTALLAVPAWGATGGTLAFLVGVACSTSLGFVWFHREVGVWRLVAVLASSAAVLVLGLAV